MTENLAVDPYVQKHVARTNGRLYRPLVNALPRYPIPKWPFPATKCGDVSLDIGCGWGRWMVSAANAGYLPVGVDIQTERLQAARRVLAQHHIRGYVVAADLQQLPFRSEIFDRVFSYSVLQHSDRARCMDCIREILRVLRPLGRCCLEFPISHGLANWRFQVRRHGVDDPESWNVRYYSRKELRDMTRVVFESVDIEPDSFLGIGVRPEDLDLLPWKYKPVVVASEALKALAKRVSFVRWLSDSVYVRGQKPPSSQPSSRPDSASPFPREHNLWILPWLACPVTSQPLEYDDHTHSLLSPAAGLRYPIEDDVPVLIPESAQRLGA